MQNISREASQAAKSSALSLFIFSHLSFTFIGSAAAAAAAQLWLGCYFFLKTTTMMTRAQSGLLATLGCVSQPQRLPPKAPSIAAELISCAILLLPHPGNQGLFPDPALAPTHLHKYH